mmetsp:Transcript_14566/g.43444  ORF Transcript_14566/g.43444 Transcript_14566/m.43444 type:complete len:106 (+) Transcript_14566:180-497(+)
MPAIPGFMAIFCLMLMRSFPSRSSRRIAPLVCDDAACFRRDVTPKVGLNDGAAVGAPVGTDVGGAVGTLDGTLVGAPEGALDGIGEPVGGSVGLLVGNPVGAGVS